MTNDELRIAIAALLAAHPLVEPSPAGHNQHARRFRAVNGAQIGWQDELKSKQNLYVERDCINLRRLSDIEHTIHQARDFATSMPNHNLFAVGAFARDRDVVAFSVTDIAQAARIVAEVAA